jgi:hypothetical protein
MVVSTVKRAGNDLAAHLFDVRHSSNIPVTPPAVSHTAGSSGQFQTPLAAAAAQRPSRGDTQRRRDARHASVAQHGHWQPE